jgi:hypothetical protein
MKCYRAKQIGILAKESLSRNTSSEVVGITSKGIFLKLVDRSIIFLSNNEYGNPLTINLSSSPKNLFVQPRDLIHIRDGSLYFENSWMINTQQASIWSSQPVERPFIPPPQRSLVKAFLSNLRSMLDQPVVLLDEVLAIFEPPSNSLLLDSEIQSALQILIKNALTSPSECVEAIQFFAGRGRGLTPSGDDLLSGWIYMLRRWAISVKHPIEPLQHVLLRAVDNRTTDISLNLIKAACQGEIDERLLTAFEMMIGTRPVQDKLVRNILEWGSSSGVEVCAGFGLGALTIKHWKN